MRGAVWGARQRLHCYQRFRLNPATHPAEACNARPSRPAPRFVSFHPRSAMAFIVHVATARRRSLRTTNATSPFRKRTAFHVQPVPPCPRRPMPSCRRTPLTPKPVTCQLASASTLPSTASPSLLTILSTIVGVCVLIGSLLYKIPQVLRVVRRRSAEGISILMYALETVGTTFSAVYFARRAFPFATYGESVFIMAQNVILMALIVLYQKLPRVPAICTAILYLASLIILYSNYVPLRILTFLQVCSIPILNLARVPQIILNWRRKGTGELSPITLGLQLLGNVARIFTTIAQVRDPLMFAGIFVATCFNSTLFIQWLHYSRRVPDVIETIPNS